jgi:hypothetical protein
MEILTNQFLKRHSDCEQGIKYVNDSHLIGKTYSEVIKHLILSNEAIKLRWANWLIVRGLNLKQKSAYAFFAVENYGDVPTLNNKTFLDVLQKSIFHEWPKGLYYYNVYDSRSVEANDYFTINIANIVDAYAYDIADKADNNADAAYNIMYNIVFIEILKFGLTLLN